MPQLSIIIVNYNVKFFVQQCLYAVQKATANVTAEIIVVDNASVDGSMEYLLSRFPEVIFIDNPVNVGYSRANNQGLEQARGEYILFLNPDTIIPEDCLEVCIQFLHSNVKVGACGVRMIDGNGRFLPESKRGFPSLAASFYKLSGLTRMFPGSKTFARYYLGHLNNTENSVVDVLSGAFFMVRKQVLEKTGGFDEQFFMYGEDIDLSYRIQQAGFANCYLAATTIIHFKGESTAKGTLQYTRQFYRAMSIFVHKHHSSNLGRLNFFIECSIWMRAGLSAASGMLKRTRPQQVQNTTTLVIGNSRERLTAISILKSQIQAGRNVNEMEPGNNLPEMIALSIPDEIVFCTGSLSYKSMISLMHDMPGKVSFMFYNEKAGSIIGSHTTFTSVNVMA